ncbi:uncharacterized protein [Lepisosteus oculatus]|uniref:Ig-like domain-containing protein n=1 Tax=Lepisosteus oculatus TaxID=7918 RepID=W5MYI4_LEPOC
MIKLWVALGLLWKSYVAPEYVITQPCLSVSAQLGDSVTLECYVSAKSVTRVWLKQSVGQSPRVIVTSYYNDENFHGEFKNNSKYSVQKHNKSFHIKLTVTSSSDAGMYYCGIILINYIQFANGTFLAIKELESMSRSVVQQPVSVPVHPGDDVTLQCITHTETCAGGHNIYWFRRGSGESLPGIIYTHRNWSNKCNGSFDAGSPTQSCVYNLPKRNLSSSDAGTYYCAVAICGEILFGNGTLLEITGELDPVVLVLGTTNAVCVIVIAVLICTRNTHCAGNVKGTTKSIHVQNEDTDMLNYAALSFTQTKTKTRRKSREMDSLAVYSQVKRVTEE